MAVVGINTKCFILALFIRDDNERFLLGDGYYEFKNDLKHFQANTIVNDVVEVQGNDGYLLAGQVRRSGTQEFNGYIADGTVSKTNTEDHRRQFFSFFRKNHFYKVVYVMPDGSAIQRKRGFLVDDPTVSEMYQQYPEYHVALNFEDINYYVYDEDSEGHEIYGKSAVIGLIQGLSGGLIWDALGAVSDGFTWTNPVNVSGANITINNQLGAMAPIDDLELKGDVSQNTYTGKNLLENKLTSTTINNVTATLNSDGSVKLTGTSNSSSNTWFIMHDNTFVLPAGTYTYSGGISSSVALYNDSFGAVTSSTTKTLTGSSSGNWSIRVAPNAATNVTVFPMVERGSSPTTFEPYVGGVPSPNPSYPQNIYTVSGEQRVSVRTGKNMIDLSAATTGYIVSNTNGQLGVNANYSASDWIPVVAGGHYYQTATNVWYACYYDKNKNFIAQINSRYIRPTQDGYIRTSWENTKADQVMMEVGDSGTTYEPYMGKSYTVGLTGKNLSAIDGYTNIGWGESKSDFLPIVNSLPAGTYNLSMKFTLTARTDTSDASVYGIYFQNSGGNWNDRSGTWGTKTVGDSVTFSHSFTISAGGVGNFSACYFYGCGIQGTGQTGTTNITEIMLEKGSSSSGYTPYFTPIELAKIGTHQDYIYKSSGDWYVKKATKKEILDTTGNWNTQNGVFRKDFAESARSGYQEAILVICNRFVGQSTRYRDDIADLCCAKIINSDQIAFRYDALNNDVSAWTTWLTDNTTILYYALATPTDTLVTDATLISQLEALGAMRLYVGENNLSVSSASLPAILDFDYYSGIDYSGAGYEWEDGGTGGPETITVDSIDNVYPVWTVTGPALNPQLSVLTTNTTTTYAGTVAVGQTLAIDMFNKTATLNGTSVIGNVAGDWANFKPGNNRVIYSTNNADAPASKIEWQEVVG